MLTYFRWNHIPRSSVRLILAAVILILVAGALNAQRALAAPSGAQDNELTVVVKPIEPFVFTDGTEPRGFSIDLWRAVALEAGLNYRFMTVDTVTEALENVHDGVADVGIAAITITEEREKSVDFSLPYYRSGLGILTRTGVGGSSVSIIFRDLAPDLLRLMLILTVVILIAGHVIWLIERGRNDEFPTNYVHGVMQGIWWAAVTVTTVGYGDKTPIRPIGRLFGILWMFAGLFIIANFTASVTAALTADRLATIINGPDDLAGHTVATVAGSTSEQWLIQEGIRYRATEFIGESYELLNSGAVDAVVYDYPVLEYYVFTEDDTDAVLVEGAFNSELYGMVLEQGSPLSEAINLALLRVIENGTYDTIHVRWFGSEGDI